jgi:hypothetical protein
MFLDEGDVAEIRRSGVRVIDREGNSAERPIGRASCPPTRPRRGQYRHFMLKEIHEQPRAVANTLQERVANGRLLEAAFGPAATASSIASRRCTSWPAAPAITPASWRAISSSRSAAFPARDRDRQRISLSQSRGGEEHAVRRDLAVR